MDWTSYVFVLLSVFYALFYLLWLWQRKSTKHYLLPPGPYSFPIIGNLLQVGKTPHLSLTKLSKTYGPLMHLKLGGIHTIVVSSPEIAKMILQKHDQSFPGRRARAVTKAHNHHQTSVACLPVGTKWRNLRKICREQMFSTQRLDASRGLRQDKLQKLLHYVQDCCLNGRVIDIGEAAFVTSLNLISNTLFSLDFVDYNTDSSQELKEIVHRLMKVLGSPNLSDYFSIFSSFDPQGIKKEAEFCFGKLLNKFDGIIDSRLPQSFGNRTRKNDLLEALLEISEDTELSRNDINHLLLDLFVAGTDTTSGTVEWIMTELLRNPNVMSKAKYELKSIIGDNKQIQESDISKLPYLQAIVKESFRYHPPGSFLARYKGDPNVDLKINNFIIPNNASVIINIWAIGRDPNVWSNPESFDPDRFLNCEIDFKGHNFQLLPFGSGRRICPALPLADRMVHLVVASLIHNFDWKLENGMAPEQVDITEKFGLSLQKATPLRAIPFK